MDSSNLTGLDFAVIAVLSITVVAVVIMFFLLMIVSRKLSSKADTNVDATMRFKTTLDGNAELSIAEKRVKTQLGIVAFTNKKSEEELTDVEADIVINIIPPKVTFSGMDVSGSFEVVNNTNRDLTIERLAFYPAAAGATIAEAKNIETHFTHNHLPKGQTTTCNYAFRVSEKKNIKLNGDITLTHNKISEVTG